MSTTALGQSSGQQQPSEKDLSQKVINPIELLMRLTAENKYSPSLWNSLGEENEVEGVAVVPFKAFNRQNLFRAKAFFETSKPGGTHGLSELQISDLLLSERSWGTFGAGISAELTSESSSSLGTLAPGPAIGASVKHGQWNYGFFNRNFLSDTLAQTELQPILGYAFDRKWSAEIGDAQYTYDWKKHRVTLIPLSAQLNRIVSLESQDIHLPFRAQYNAANNSGSDKWTLEAGFSLIMRKQ